MSETEIDARLEALISAAFKREVIRKVKNVVVPLSAVGARPPLYCVHPLGGGVTEFKYLVRRLGSKQSFFGIQAPTDKRNAEFGRSIVRISKFYVDELVKFQPEGAFLLGGYSIGATIALEMAQQLIAMGREVSLLVIFDGHLCNTGAEMSTLNPLYWFRLLLNVPRWLFDEQPWRHYHGYARKAAAGLKSVARLALGRERDATHPVERHTDLNRYPPDHAAFIKAAFDARLKYVPHHYPGRVLVFVARTQALLNLRQVGATWTVIAPLSEIVEVDGTHASILREPNVGPVAERLRAAITTLDQRN